MKNYQNYLTVSGKKYKKSKNELEQKIKELEIKMENTHQKIKRVKEGSDLYDKFSKEYVRYYYEWLENAFWYNVLIVSYQWKSTSLQDVRRIMILNKYYKQEATFAQPGYIFPNGTIVNINLNEPAGSLYELYADGLEDMRKYFPLSTRENNNINFANAKFLSEGNIRFSMSHIEIAINYYPTEEQIDCLKGLIGLVKHYYKNVLDAAEFNVKVYEEQGDKWGMEYKKITYKVCDLSWETLMNDLEECYLTYNPVQREEEDFYLDYLGFNQQSDGSK